MHALYPGYCDMRCKCPWTLGFTQHKYWPLICWTEFEDHIWRKWVPNGWTWTYFRYFDIFLNEVLVYNWALDDERNSRACISDAKVKDDLRYSGASPIIVLNIWIAFIHITLSGIDIHLTSETIVDEWGVKITISNYSGSPFLRSY